MSRVRKVAPDSAQSKRGAVVSEGPLGALTAVAAAELHPPADCDEWPSESSSEEDKRPMRAPRRRGYKSKTARWTPAPRGQRCGGRLGGSARARLAKARALLERWNDSNQNNTEAAATAGAEANEAPGSKAGAEQQGDASRGAEAASSSGSDAPLGEDLVLRTKRDFDNLARKDMTKALEVRRINREKRLKNRELRKQQAKQCQIRYSQGTTSQDGHSQVRR